MRTKKSADVVVVGGGAIGCSAAYYLAHEGLDVVLIEKDGLGSGASGANQGVVVTQLLDPPLLQLALESRRLYASLESELQFDIEFDKCGTLVCVDQENQMEIVEKRVRKLQTWGLDVCMLGPDEIHVLNPFLVKDLMGGAYCPGDGLVNPLRLVFGYARAAKRLGASIYTSTILKGISTKKGSIHSVATGSGEIRTSYVIDAAGAWSSFIGRMIGIDIPIRPARGQIVVSERLPMCKQRCVIDAQFLNVDGGWESQARSFLGSVLVQNRSQNWTIGCSREFVGFNRGTTLDITKRLVRQAVRIVPQLRYVDFIRTFAGLRPFAQDGLPIISEVESMAGFIIATGHGGEGITLSPITGKLVSELVTGEIDNKVVRELAFSRFTDCLRRKI